MCVGITIIKWDNTCHSQTHGTISPCFLSTPPFILSLSLLLSLSLSLSLFLSPSLSPPSFSLWLQDTCHLMPFTKYSLLDQSYLFHAKSCHSSYKIHQLFTDSILRLASSELLEKRVFRSRANRRLVSRWCIMMQNNLPVCLALSVAPHCLKGCIYRRKFRNQTSDNMDRWNSRGGKSQRGEDKKREDQRGERVRRKKMQVREKIGKSRFTVFFQWFVAPEGRKVTSLKRRDAEPSGQMRNEKLHAVVARSTFPSQNAQSTSASEQF